MGFSGHSLCCTDSYNRVRLVSIFASVRVIHSLQYNDSLSCSLIQLNGVALERSHHFAVTLLTSFSWSKRVVHASSLFQMPLFIPFDCITHRRNGFKRKKQNQPQDGSSTAANTCTTCLSLILSYLRAYISH